MPAIPSIRSVQQGIIRAFFLLAFVRHVAVFYPGYLPADTLYILSMGLGREPLSNWHPPAVSLALGGLYTLVQHIGVIWLLQCALFFWWIRSNALRYRKPSTACASALLFILWPPLITNLATLWKDSWAILATLYLFTFIKDTTRTSDASSALAAMAMTTLAVVIRPDYLPIVAPLLAAGAWSLRGDSTIRQRVNAVVVALGSVILCWLAIRLGSGLLVEKQVNPWVTTAIWDAAGARVWDSRDEDGLTVAGKTLSKQKLTELYRPTSSDTLIFGLEIVNLPQAPLRRPVDEEVTEVRQLWWDALFHRTTGYLRHRLEFAKVFLGIGTAQVYAPYAFGVIPNAFGFTFERTPANIAAYWIFDPLAHGLLWRLWIYLGVTIAAVAVATIRRSPPLALPLGLSVIGALTRIVVLPAADFRYGLWMVCGALLLALEVWDSLDVPSIYAPLTRERLANSPKGSAAIR